MRVNGYEMAYVERGSGPTIVFVPGVLTDHRYFQRQVDALSKDFRVISVSLRHFYPEKWSGKNGTFSARQHASDLDAFIKALGEPVYLVGWSYGGRIASETARDNSGLIRKLVLVEAGTDSFVADQDPTVNKLRAQRSEQTAQLFESGDIDGGLAFAVDSISGPGAWNAVPEQFRQRVRDNAWTVVGIGRDEPDRVTCADFGALKMPVLLIVGEATTPRFKRIVQAQSGCLPSAPVVVIPKAGHSSAAVNPAAFNDAVMSFIRK
jgi:pimeloyl-ACP methyl ester carboxylesterase